MKENKSPLSHEREGNSNKKRGARLKSLIILAFVIILATIASLLVILPGKSFANGFTLYAKSCWKGSRQVAYPYLSDHDEILAVKKIGSGLEILDANELRTLNSEGKELFVLKHSFVNPGLEVNRGKAILFDRQNGRVKVLGRYGVFVEKEFEENILAVAIGKKNNWAVAGKRPGYSSVARVYDKNGHEIFKQSFQNDRISSLALSEDGKSLAVALIGAKDAALYSRLVVYDFGKEEAVGFLEYPDTAILKIAFGKNKSLALVGDNYCGFVNLKDFSKSDNYLAHGKLKDYSFSERGKLSVLMAEKGSGGQTTLTVFDYDGHILFEEKLDATARSLSSDEIYTGVLLGDSYLTFSGKGTLLGKRETGKFTFGIVTVGKDTYELEKRSVFKNLTLGFYEGSGKEG
ncbi:MAG TPA: DUF5711 family protein [Clostridiales bacterium]|nr:DUF5711 family protein [Clostridiales bacterium]